MCISHGGAGKEESAGQGEKGGDGRRDVLRKLSRTDIGRGRRDWLWTGGETLHSLQQGEGSTASLGTRRSVYA